MERKREDSDRNSLLQIISSRISELSEADIVKVQLLYLKVLESSQSANSKSTF